MVYRISLILFFITTGLFANTKFTNISVTSTQGLVCYYTDQSSAGTWRASKGSTFTTMIPDILDNGNTDDRVGSKTRAIGGKERCLVLGTHTGNDSLVPDNTYWVGVTVGSDSEISTVIHTITTPAGIGNTFPLPFDSTKWQNINWPTVNWQDKSQSVIDPNSGIEGWRLTGPDPNGPAITSDYTINQPFSTAPVDLANTNTCTNISNLANQGRSFATCHGGTSDKFFIPLPSNSYNDLLQQSLDDILVTVYCGNAGNSTTNITAYLTLDSGQTMLGQTRTSVNCPTSTPAQVSVLPGVNPQPFLTGWGVTNPVLSQKLMSSSGSIQVLGNIATVKSPGIYQNYFNEKWAVGTKLNINGASYCPSGGCTISSIQSSTQVTLNQNSGCNNSDPSVCPITNYTSQAVGIVIYKNNPSTNVDVSVGYKLAKASVPFKGVNGEQPRFNLNSVTVTKADCLVAGPHAGFAMNELGKWVSCTTPLTFTTPLKGNIWTDGVTALWLFVPYNSDGSSRAENRYLGYGKKLASYQGFTANGDPFDGAIGVLLNLGSWDEVDGNSIYAMVQNDHTYPGAGQLNWLFKLTYDETLNNGTCAGYLTFTGFKNSNGYADENQDPQSDCFRYTNLTPHSSSPPHTLRAQIIRGYQTGLNYNGETVGASHPGFDMNWLIPSSTGLGTSFSVSSNIVCVPWGIGDGFSGVAAFDSTGKLIFVQDNWSTGNGRWGATHGECTSRMGTYEQGTQNHLQNFNNNNVVFGGSHTTQVDAVNRVDPPGSPIWNQAGTVINGTEAILCSGLVSPYDYLNGTRNCLSVRTTTPLCSNQPSTAYIFPDGLTEEFEFPCKDPIHNITFAGKSAIQLLKVGDWLSPGSVTNADGQTDHYIVGTVNYDSSGRMLLTLIRWACTQVIAPLVGGIGDKPISHDQPANWSLHGAPTYGCSGDGGAGAASWWRDVTNPNNTVQAGAPTQAASHGFLGHAPTPGNWSAINFGYAGIYDKPIPQVIIGPILPFSSSTPGFARSRTDLVSSLQNYLSATAWKGTQRDLRNAIDFRAENPIGGGPDENPSNRIGGNQYTLTLISGTTHTYKITDILTSSPSFKRVPYFARGNRLFRDMSAPDTFGSNREMPLDSFCRAYKANECQNGSSVGDLFISSSPMSTLTNDSCHSDIITINYPCAYQLVTWDSQLIEFDTGVGPDPQGARQRKLGSGMGLPGSQYSFTNSTLSPDGGYYLFVKIDGVRRDFFAFRRPPWPELDSVDKSIYVPVNITTIAPVNTAFVRARFGYKEFYDNGTGHASLFHCTAYAQECSTEIPSGAPTDPFSFTNESVTKQSVTPGLPVTITIPSNPGMVLYYVIDWLNSGGSVIRTTPMQIIAQK